MNKRSSILLSLVLFASFLQAQIITENDTFCANIYNSFECARKIERSKLLKQPKLLSRHGDTLRFWAEKSPQFMLIDKFGETDSGVAYSYLNFIQPQNLFVIHVQYYEGTKIMLINSKTGREILIANMPIFSPDSTYFVVSNLGIGNTNRENLIEIWKTSLENLEPEFKYSNFDVNEWGPLKVEWVNKYSLKVVQGMLDEDKTDLLEANTVNLIIRDGKWIYSP